MGPEIQAFLEIMADASDVLADEARAVLAMPDRIAELERELEPVRWDLEQSEAAHGAASRERDALDVEAGRLRAGVAGHERTIKSAWAEISNLKGELDRYADEIATRSARAEKAETELGRARAQRDEAWDETRLANAKLSVMLLGAEAPAE